MVCPVLGYYQTMNGDSREFLRQSGTLIVLVLSMRTLCRDPILLNLSDDGRCVDPASAIYVVMLSVMNFDWNCLLMRIADWMRWIQQMRTMLDVRD